MKTRVGILLIALAVFLPSTHAQNDAAAGTSAQVAAQVAAQAAVRRHGTLYRVQHEGGTVYLFGTIHVGKPGFYPLGNEVTQALSRASRLAVEFDVRDKARFEQALRKHGMYAGGDSIERHLSPSMLPGLKNALARAGVSFDNVAHLKPWVLTNMLVSLDLQRDGYDRAQGIEFFLLAMAQQQAKAVEDALRDAQNDRTMSSSFLQRVLFDRRNSKMTEKIAALLDKGEIVFVGVGLLHLVGDNGLPMLPRKRGHKVEKLH